MRKILLSSLMTFIGFSFPVVLLAQCSVSVTPGGTTTICSGSSIDLQATVDPGYTYQWYRNNVLLPAGTASTFTTATHGTYYCIVTSGVCTGTSNSIVINVSNDYTPTIDRNTPITFCPPGSVVLNANNDVGITYQWENNSVPIPGATSPSYTVTAPGLYRALETVGICSKYTPKVAVSLATSVHVTITSDVLSIPCTGGSVNFTVSNPIPGYSYQWQLDGVDITGATGTTYSTTIIGIYSCVVSASCGTAASNPIKITEGGIVAELNPSGVIEICSGTSVVLNATQGTGYSYEWYRNNVLLPGITTDTFATSTHGFYYCIISSGSCTSTTNTVEVKVLNATTPTIGHSTPLSFCPPGYVVLFANTDPGITYQWEVNSVPIAGATSPTYSVTSPGLYRVLETLGTCSKYTSKLNVSLATSVNAAITSTATVVSCSGSDVILTVANAIPGYGYQWSKNGVAIAGATDTTYATSEAGDYFCEVSASCGIDTSNTITLLPGEIDAEISPAGNVAICLGSSIMLTAAPSTGSSYQWQESGVDIPGATNPTLTVSVPGSYTVTIDAPCGIGYSAATVISYGTITAQITPAGTTQVCSGTSQTFTAATGSGYTYSWYRNNLPLNITTSSYTTATSGNYKVVVSLNGTCTETSNTVVLKVLNNPTPVITANAPLTICSTDSITFTTNSFSGVTYQWQKNSIDIAGETNQTYTAHDAGTYRVRQTANGCSKHTPKRKVTVITCREGNEIAEETVNNEVMKVYPNPFLDELNIEVPTAQQETIEVTILDVLGKTVYSQLLTTNTVNKMDTRLPQGIYMVKAIVDGQAKVVRVVKTK